MWSWGLMAGLPFIGLLLLATGAQTQDECNLENIIMGRYFHPHPTICTKYLQCAQLASGGWFGKPRNCAPGLFWDVYSTSCRTPFELRRPCANDPCIAGMVKYEAENHCRSYFTCSGQTTHEMLCCERGEKYDPASKTCVLDLTLECFNDVCTEGPAIKNFTCRLTTFTLDRRFFYETVPAFGEMTRIMRNCPAGTAFNEEQCGCTDRAPPPILPGCYSSLMLNFAGNRVRDFEFGHYVENLAVALNEQLSLGLFRGAPARLIIPRLANQDWRDEFVFYVTFATQRIQQTDAVLLSNSGCSDETPSIKLAIQNNNILEGSIVTEDGTRTSVSVPFGEMGLNEAIFLYEGAVLQLRVLRPDLTVSNDAINVPAAPSNVALRRCALQVGYGTGSNFFRGFIDQVQVLLCK